MKRYLAQIIIIFYNSEAHNFRKVNIPIYAKMDARAFYNMVCTWQCVGLPHFVTDIDTKNAASIDGLSSDGYPTFSTLTVTPSGTRIYGVNIPPQSSFICYDRNIRFF